jgi:hypothetical protein
VLPVVEAVEPRRMMLVTPAFVEIPISAAARASDPTLSSLRSFDIRLTVTSGDDWLASDLLLRLTSGSFYNPGAGGNAPTPAAWTAFPHLEYDTFVAAPDFGSPTILGRSEGPGAAIFSPSELNVAFGDLEDTGAGTFTVARITVSANAVGTLNGSLFSKAEPGTKQPFTFQIAPLTSEIRGKVFNDVNANGRLDSTESGLARWQVFLDANNNGRLDTNEVSVRTNTRGDYVFTNPGNASHRVRVRVQDTFRRTAPSNGSYNVTLSTGVVSTGKNFGVSQRAKISGFVFNDLDRDRVRDSGEPGLSGWRVYIDRDNDGRFDANETSVRTAADGSWAFDNLSVGSYNIRLVQVSGFVPTSPTNNLITVSVALGSERTGRLFGQRAV